MYFIVEDTQNTTAKGHQDTIFTYADKKIILRGNSTPNQYLACFVLYLKIINTFLKCMHLIVNNIVQGTQN